MKRHFKKIILLNILLIFGLSIFGLKTKAQTYEYDLGITSSDIFFSNSVLISGQPIRIYAAVKNHGARDVVAYALFYAGPNLIGESQVVSVRAGGWSDEVFVDWIVPSGSFNIRVDIKGQAPRDENPANDSAVTVLFYPEKDTDEDGVVDKNDNCANVFNPDQGDVDGDGIGDVCDQDDDNDGVSDNEERSGGTSSVNPDTDGDSVLDGKDNCPTIANPGQEDKDKDRIGDACDLVDNRTTSLSKDQDRDGIPDNQDNCKSVANASQQDTDKDGVGDACDNDDGDGLNNSQEDSFVTNPKNSDADSDQIIDKEDSNPLVSDVEGQTINEEEFYLIGKETSDRNQKGLENVLIEFVRINSNTYFFKAGAISSLGYFKYEWDFGDGTKSDQKEVKHTFLKSGLYKITLKVSDQFGNVKETEAEIKVKRNFDSLFIFSGLLTGLLLGGVAWHIRKKSKVMLDIE